MDAAARRLATQMQRFALPLVVALGLVLFGWWRLPAGLGLPRPAQIALSITGLAALGWITEIVPLFVTSMGVLALCLLWLRGALQSAGQVVALETFTAPFFSDVILLFLGGFVLSAAFKVYRIDEDVAQAMLRRTGSSVSALLIGLMGVTALLSMWLSNTATAAMMLALVVPIVERLPAGDPNRKALFLSIPLAANIGGMGTPIGTPPNAIAIQYLSQAKLAPSFADWLVIAVPAVFLMLLLTFGVLRWLYRGGSALSPPSPSTRRASKPPTYGRRHYLVLVVAALTALGWLTSSMHGLSSGTVALLPVLAYFGLGILQVEDLRQLSWDVLLVMGGGLCLGEAIAVSGLAEWIVAQLPAAQSSAWLVVSAFAVAACVMSSTMSNTATANLLMPILMQLELADKRPLLMLIAFVCSLTMPLPVSTPPNAMAFSTGELKVADMLRAGGAVTLLGLALVLLAGWLFGRITGMM
ncbi:MAG: SLC13 family permease [Polyangiales bacterium]